MIHAVKLSIENMQSLTLLSPQSIKVSKVRIEGFVLAPILQERIRELGPRTN
jgi:hypothetical protein